MSVGAILAAALTLLEIPQATLRLVRELRRPEQQLRIQNVVGEQPMFDVVATSWREERQGRTEKGFTEVWWSGLYAVSNQGNSDIVMTDIEAVWEPLKIGETLSLERIPPGEFPVVLVYGAREYMDFRKRWADSLDPAGGGRWSDILTDSVLTAHSHVLPITIAAGATVVVKFFNTYRLVLNGHRIGMPTERSMYWFVACVARLPMTNAGSPDSAQIDCLLRPVNVRVHSSSHRTQEYVVNTLIMLPGCGLKMDFSEYFEGLVRTGEVRRLSGSRGDSLVWIDPDSGR